MTIYFASDVHLGAPYIKDKRAHEKRFVDWLDTCSQDADEIFLVGDIFDFWWEYKRVVPRGFTRTLGKLSELTDKGIIVHFFTGNHDIWLTDYLENECGVVIHRKALKIEINNEKFHIAHGDEYSTDEKGYQFMRYMFHNKFLQWAFATFIHPNFAVRLGTGWSGESRKRNTKINKPSFRGEEGEYLVKFAKKDYKKNNSNYYIFGHRHFPLDLMISKDSRVIVLGDWLTHFTFAKYQDGEMILTNF